MEKAKKMTFGVLAMLVLLPAMLLLSACGDPYEIEYGEYQVVGYLAINHTTNERTEYGRDDDMPVSFRFTGSMTLNEDGTISNCQFADAYSIDSDGNIDIRRDNATALTGYFEGDVLYVLYTEEQGMKSTEDIVNNTPDDEATFYTMYAIYTLNGTPLPTDDTTTE